MGKVTKIRKPLGVTIAVGNQKGGVGKTTNSVHIAAALGEMGHRVLLVDLDPTASATKHLGFEPEDVAGTPEVLLAYYTVEQAALKAGELSEGQDLPENVDLIPSRLELARLDEGLKDIKDARKLLIGPLAEAKKTYDFIILDTAPHPGNTTTFAAYSAADWFLLSVFPAPLAIAGLSDALKDFVEIKKNVNKELEVLGVVISSVKRSSNLWKECVSILESYFPKRSFKSTVSNSVVMERLSGEGVTLFQRKKFRKHKLTEEYRNLAREIELRVQNREAFISGKLRKKAKLRRVG